jgi:hypothetical protein
MLGEGASLLLAGLAGVTTCLLPLPYTQYTKHAQYTEYAKHAW